MFDFDIAELYGVPTKALNQGVKRNRERFPEDFMFQLTTDELENWRSQIVTSNLAVKMGLRRPPYAFTEHGVTMLASVLKSDQAAQMSIRIVRAFVQLREMLAAHRDLTLRVDRIEQQQHTHASVIDILAEEIDNLKLPQAKPFKQPIGFKVLASGGGGVARRQSPHTTDEKGRLREAAKSAIKEVQQSLTKLTLTKLFLWRLVANR